MIHEILEVDENASLEDIAVKFSGFLGIKEKVPMEALLRAINDPSYAQNLIISRQAPGFLNALLADPQNKEYAVKQKKELSNTDLVKKAGTALLNWSKAGFTVVSSEVLEKREDACLSCEHLGKPEKFLQKLVTSKSGEAIGKRAADCVCKVCGCSISKKIRIPSESCPVNMPGHPELNKWGELIKD
ncbi:hypothetical protein ECE50_005560 [Chitinophaga sp. Mgbs1]|uniref:Uncharacterized protein n=1 Tax=Chitinophaga solisilvae TaxID=1233460 RepID=A0A3S1D483_9BACT|nr:hypothetical protein [Chitinophaga solisilvae]